MVTPVFILSLPRSGSTLVQRVLSRHPKVATVSEPWVLLPLLYGRKIEGIVTEYGQDLAVQGIEDLVQTLPQGEATYQDSLRAFAARLYDEASPPGTSLFIDKTPNYALVVEQVMGLFPEGRFIFLWRDPLAVIASILETWWGGKWGLHHHSASLFHGLEKLVSAVGQRDDVSVRYEDLVSGNDAPWRAIFSHLGLTFDPAYLENLQQVGTLGRLGDQKGSTEYDGITSESVEKWRRVLNNPVRRWWCRRYLDWIGEVRLQTMGYSSSSLLAELSSTPTSLSRVPSDLTRLGYGMRFNRDRGRLLRATLPVIPPRPDRQAR